MHDRAMPKRPRRDEQDRAGEFRSAPARRGILLPEGPHWGSRTSSSYGTGARHSTPCTRAKPADCKAKTGSSSKAQNDSLRWHRENLTLEGRPRHSRRGWQPTSPGTQPACSGGFRAVGGRWQRDLDARAFRELEGRASGAAAQAVGAMGCEDRAARAEHRGLLPRGDQSMARALSNRGTTPSASSSLGPTDCATRRVCA